MFYFKNIQYKNNQKNEKQFESICNICNVKIIIYNESIRFLGVILLFNRRKNEITSTYLGYALIIGGFSWFAYSSKALLLLMYQKFIQEEVNIQIQQQTKQIQKNQSKKKQQIKNENLSKNPAQQYSTTQEAEISYQQKEYQQQKEIKKENQKVVDQEKQTKQKQEDVQQQKVKNVNNSQIQSQQQTQVKKEKKQQQIKQPLLQQQENNDNDDEWVEVGNKKKQLNRPQKKEEEVQIKQQNQQPQKNQVVQQQQQQIKPQVQTNKQDPPKVDLIESNKTQNKKEKKQKQKIEEPVEEDDDEWISVEVKQKKKNVKADVEQITDNTQQKSRGLFTKEEQKKLKDDANLIEEIHRKRIQLIDDQHHFKQISRLTQYEIKNADQILNNQNQVFVPKIELKIPDIKPKNYTREEIDKLVQAKMPKPKNIVSNDVFIEKSEPIQAQPNKNQQVDNKVLKSKFTLFKPVQLEQKQKEQIIYTDPSISFIINKDKQKSFFSDQIELTTNTSGKELFGRVKRYRRPIQVKNKSDTKGNKNVQVNQQFITDNNDNFEPILQDQVKVILPGYQTLDIEGRNKLIRDSVPVLYRQDFENDNILEEETVTLILGGSQEIIHQEYIQLLNRFRELRRKSLQERKYEEYINLIKQMDEDIYQLSQKGIHIIIQCLNIVEEDYQKAFLFYSQQPEFVSQLAFFQQNLKDILPAKFQLNKQQGIELIKYKINIIEHHESNQQFSSVMKLFNSQQDSNNIEIMPILLNSLIDDIIYQKFGYEEEDKIRFMKLFNQDQEIRELQLKLDHLVENLQGVKQS
ncbi:unnamed protein product [Paramecium primaurelia]|uniref:Transmembrane protein n=1 Tax=Paramecium primaurelia TaxID=5886 RepID=A0A8S1JP73_PARPR|nr:unnamed protein product [Paramecium primaurelia]